MYTEHVGLLVAFPLMVVIIAIVITLQLTGKLSNVAGTVSNYLK